MTDLDVLEVYARMLTIRAFEEHVAEAVLSGEIHGEMHLAIGQESVGAVLQGYLRDSDAVVSTHRAHPHALAAGVEPVALAAELLERDGLNRGKGGHMHLFCPERSFMCTGIVGASAPLALGYALAQRDSSSALTVAVAGDAAINQGAVMESLNLAAVLPLPVLFLVEDNKYGISVPRSVSTAGSLHERGTPMGIPSWTGDGRDVASVDAAIRQGFAHVREHRSPAVVVIEVYRFRGHYEGDADLYRDRAEKDRAMSPEHDPLARCRADLLRSGHTEADLLAVQDKANETVSAWFSAAREIPLPDPRQAHEGVYADV